MQLVFTKTRILSVKVATLLTFLAMVKTLDQVELICQPYNFPSDTCFVDKSYAKTCPPSVKDKD